MLREKQLFDDVDLVATAIDRLRLYEPPEGYYLAFSGGKDSMVIYHLAVEAGVKFEAHMALTTVDPPELIRFVHKNYPDVEMTRPVESMFDLIPRKVMPPTRVVRYCCAVLKEQQGNGRFVVTGVRWQESARRKAYKMVSICKKQALPKKFIHPIIDWTTREVWEFIKGRGLPYCSLYDEGFKRIGCVLCPMQGGKGMKRDAARWPNIHKRYMRAFEVMLQERNRKGMESHGWPDADAVWRWWIANQKGGDVGCPLFE